MQKTEGELYFLNTVRWVSAFVVAGGHALALVFKHDPIGRANSLAENTIVYCADLGHAAVMLFFVLSGYLVGGSVLGRPDKFDLGFYAISRFARIYIALIPAILLTASLDGLAYFIGPTNPVYATQWAGPINHPIFAGYSPQNIFATVFSLENVIGEPMGSDRPLWSLGYEWLFYILFPLALLVVKKPKSWGGIGQAFAIGGVVLLMLVTGRRYMTVFWLIWVLGAYAKLAADKELVPLWLARLGGVAALLGFLAAPVIEQRITDPIIGVGFALFLGNRTQLYANLNKGLDHYLASFSYSLYIVHLPLMAFIMMLLVNAGVTTTARLDFGVKGVLIWLLLIGVGGGVGCLFGFLFERRTDDLRRFLARKLKVGRPAPVPVAIS